MLVSMMLGLKLAEFLLPACLGALLLGWFLDALPQKYWDIGPWLRRNRRRILVTIATLVFLFVELPIFLPTWIDFTNPLWKYWLATLAGNWAPPDKDTAEVLLPFWYVFSIILAILLNNAIYLVIIGTIWAMVKRYKHMDKADGWIIHQAFVELAMAGLLRQADLSLEQQANVKTMLKSAFKQGTIDTLDSASSSGRETRNVFEGMQLPQADKRAESKNPAPN